MISVERIFLHLNIHLRVVTKGRDVVKGTATQDRESGSGKKWQFEKCSTDGRQICRIHFIPRDPLSGLVLLVLAVRRDEAEEVQQRPESLAIGRG